MTITIAPFTINLGTAQVGYKEERRIKGNHPQITYWGIYLDDRYISQTSSKELAEKTKLWIQKWLEDRL